MINRLAVGLVCGIAVVLSAVQVRADEPVTPLDELLQTPISTASKYDQQMSDVPASVTVITAEEIARYGWRTLADVLNSTSGVYTTYDRAYTYLGVRGVGLPSDYNNRFLVLIDGINMTLPGSIGIGTTLAIDLASFSRIEFIRGPGSTMYGTGAMFGVINLITKDERERSSVTVGGGSAGLMTGAARASIAAGELKGSVAVSWQESRGRDLYIPEYDAPETNHGVVRRGDWDHDRSILATARWRDVQFLALQSTRSKGVPTGSWGTEFGGSQKITDGRTLFAIEGTRRLGAGKTLTARAFNDRFDYHGSYPFEGGSVLTDNSSTSSTSAELQYVWDIRPTQRLTAGAGYVNSRISTYAWALDGEAFSVGAPYETLSLSAQLESKLSRLLTLTVGASYDNRSGAAAALTPKGALILKTGRNSALKVLYGRAFRAPNSYEREYESGDFYASDHLGRENIRTFELVWEQKITPSVLLSAALFDQNMTDLIRLQP
ncbi:MAG: TonB-dependent receptor, partial [Acidobacteriota bacterium]